jgi:hypothetical protein
MILVDFSGTLVANLHAQFGMHQIKEVDPDLLRHMVLNTIRSIRMKFKSDGEMIIACDGRSWRREIFPYYKANRDSGRKKSELDWRAIFQAFTDIRNELKEFFPYRVVEATGAEADDVIAVLVHKFGNASPLNNGQERIVIMSPDKDFGQLHRYSNVVQFDPIKKKYITVNNPEDFLLEQIIRGDVSDGVPNIISDEDTFVIPAKRQKPMTAPRLSALKEKIPEEIMPRFLKNKELIDLTCTPPEICSSILTSFESEGGKGRGKILNYMIQKRLRNLTECISDF